MHEERRRRLRIQFSAKVMLKTDHYESVIGAHMCNISMNGLFIKTAERLPVGTPCRVEIVMTGRSSDLVMRTNGVIARLESSGLGVQFLNDLEWWAIFSIYAKYGNSDGSIASYFDDHGSNSPDDWEEVSYSDDEA
jgi:hypothetical protein